MTTSEVDQELERLFAVGREATQPDAGARERIRTGVAARLASGGGVARRAWGWRAWLGVGVGVLGVCAIAIGLRGTAPRVSTPAPKQALVEPPPAPAAAPTSTAPAPVVATTPSSASEPALAIVAPPSVSLPNKPAPPAARSAEASPDPAEELALVRSMQQALRSGSPGQALTLAAEHARRFPRGTLVEEREGVRAVAQCQLAAAPARPPILATFLQRFASSPYAARVKAACQ